jgi:hypothetical protein
MQKCLSSMNVSMEQIKNYSLDSTTNQVRTQIVRAEQNIAF